MDAISHKPDKTRQAPTKQPKRTSSKNSYKKGDQTRENILEAARQCFNRDGIADVTCRTIAKQAELSAGNVYYYFANKDVILAVLRATLDRDVVALLDHMEARRMSDAQSRRDHATDWIELVWHWRFLFLEINQLVRSSPKAKPAILEIKQRSVDLHEELFLEHLQENGLKLTEFDRKLCHDLAVSNWILSIHGLQYIAMEREDGELTKADFEAGVDQFLIIGRIMFDDKIQRRLGEIAKA